MLVKLVVRLVSYSNMLVSVVYRGVGFISESVVMVWCVLLVGIGWLFSVN